MSSSSFFTGNGFFSGTGIITPFFYGDLTLNIYSPTLSNFTVSPQNYSVNGSFSVSPPTSNSSGNFTYASANTSIVTVSGSTLNIVGAGITYITATQSASRLYKAGDISAVVVINKIIPIFGSFSMPSQTYSTGSSFAIIPPTSTSTGSFSYSTDNPAVATISGEYAYIQGVGNANIAAIQATTTNYLEASITKILTVAKSSPSIYNFTISSQPFTYGATFTVTDPSTNSTGAFTYSSSDNTIVSISNGNTCTILNAGTVTITATQAADNNYLTGTATTSVTIAAGPSTITGFSIPEKTYLAGGTFTIVDPSSNSTGAFSYTSSDNTILSITGNTANMLHSGTVTITATQQAAGNYLGNTASTSVIINKATPTIGTFTLSPRTFLQGDSFTIVDDPTTNSSGSFVYTSLNTSIATITNVRTVNILNAGTVSISATQLANGDYLSNTANASLIISKATPSITFSVASPQTYLSGGTYTFTAATSNSTGAFTYTSGTSNVATLSGTTLYIGNVGSTTITATEASSNNYIAYSVSANLVISQTSPTISWASAMTTQTYVQNGVITITAPTSNSSGAFTYSSSDPTIAQISGNTIIMLHSGAVTITATQAQTSNYASATKTATLQIDKASPNFSGFSVSTPTTYVQNGTIAITAPTTNSIGAFTYTSSDPTIAEISGNTITMLHNGTVTITATQTSTQDYLTGSIGATLTVAKATPTINWVSNMTRTYLENDTFAISTPTSISSGAFTYSSSNSTIAELSGNSNTVTIRHSGTVILTVTQAASGDYLSNTASVTLLINTASPTLSWVSNLTETYVQDDPIMLTAPPTTNSNGEFVYTIDNSGIATILWSDLYAAYAIITLHSGTAKITATQLAYGDYMQGTVDASLVISKATPTLFNFAISPKTYLQGGTFALTDPSSNSTGAFVYTSGNTSVATVSGKTVTMINTGTVDILATQTASGDYLSAVIDASLVVNPAVPTITNFSIPSYLYSLDGTITITDPSSNSTGAFTYTSGDAEIVTVSGDIITMVSAGIVNIHAVQTASGNYLQGAVDFSLNISPSVPTITNFVIPTQTYSSGGTYTIRDPSSNSTGVFTYTSGDPTIVTISGDIMTFIHSGTVNIHASQAASPDGDFLVGSADLSLVIQKAVPTLSNFNITNKTYIQGGTFTITDPSSNSTGAITYTSADTNIADVSGHIIKIINAGTTDILATQSASGDYLQGTIDASLNITPTYPTITDFSIPTQTYASGASYTISTPPTSNSTGAFTYTSSNTSIANIIGSTIYIYHAGSVNIHVSQAITQDYYIGSADISLVINPATPSITNFTIPVKSYVNGGTFALIDPSSNSAGGFNYSSGNTSIAEVSGNIVKMVHTGTVSITATQSAYGDYTTNDASTNLVINASLPTMSWSLSSQTYLQNGTFSITPPTSNSTGAYTYVIDNSAVATVSSNTVTMLHSGTINIRAIQTASGDYLQGIFDVSQVILTANPNLGVLTIPTQTYSSGGTYVITNPSSYSSGAFTYASGTPSVATVSGNTVYFLHTGTSLITATQTASGDYTSAQKTNTLTINVGTPSINNVINPTLTYYVGETYTITDPSSNSSGAFHYSSGNTSIATISNSRTMNVLNAGTVTINVSQDASGDYGAGSTTFTTYINPASPTITGFSAPTQTYSPGATFTLVDPSTNSTGAFSYSSSNTAVATISGKIVSIQGAGSTTITVTEASSNNYTVGTTTATLTVNKADPNLNSFAVTTRTYSLAATYAITPPSTYSTGAFSYTSSNTSVATISAGNIVIQGGGTTTITAIEASSNNYLASSTTTVFTVTPATTTIGTFTISSKTYSPGGTFVITPPSTNSTGAFSYTSSNTGVATIAGSTVTIQSAGSATITAIEASNNNYYGATTTTTLTVNPATPSITNFTLPTPTYTYGGSTFTVVDPSSTSTGAFTYSSGNTSVATVSGYTVSVLGAGSSIITVTEASTNNYTVGTTSGTLTVNKGDPNLRSFSVPQLSYSAGGTYTILDPSTNSTGAFSYSIDNSAVATLSGGSVNAIPQAFNTVSSNTLTVSSYTGTSTFQNGTYIASASSVSEGKQAWNMLYGGVAKNINNTDYWHCAYNGNNGYTMHPYNSNGIYQGGGQSAYYYTTTVQGLIPSVSGEWVQIQLPYKIQLTTYSLYPRLGLDWSRRSPTIIYIVGSNNGTTWYQVDYRNITPPSSTNYNPYVFNPTTTTTSYSYFRLITNQVNAGGGVIHFSDWTLTGNYGIKNLVNILSVGSATVTATETEDNNYVGGTISSSLVVVNGNPVYNNGFSIPQLTYANGGTYTVIDPSSTSIGLFYYSSSNPSVASVSGHTISILSVGTTTITASQYASGYYNSGSVSATLTITAATPLYGAFTINQQTFSTGGSVSLTPPLSTSPAMFSYSSSDTNIATVVGSTVYLLGVGTVTMTASQGATANYTAGSTTTSFTIIAGTPTITNFSFSPTSYSSGGTVTIVDPSSNSTGAFSYTSSNPSIANVTGAHTITVYAAGTVTITANQAATANFNAQTATASLVINTIAPTIQTWTIPAQNYGVGTYTLTAPTSNSTGTFTYTSSNPSVASISGSVVTVLTAGTVTVTATQGAAGNYSAGTSTTASLVINTIAPTIQTWTIPAQNYGVGTYTLTVPTSNSTGTFTYTSSNLSVASISGSVVTVLTAGTVTVTATQGAAGNYSAGTSTTASLVINTIAPTIQSWTIPAQNYGVGTYTLTAPTSNSTGTFTYTSSDPSVASISGNVVTVLTAGTVTVTATQGAAGNYSAGTSTNASLVINTIAPTIQSWTIPAQNYGVGTYTLTAPTSNSTGTFAYTSSNPSVASISGSVVTVLAAGTVTITATQAAAGNYSAGTSTTASLVITNAPTIQTWTIPVQISGGTYTLTAPTSNSTGTFTYTSSDPSVASISGNVVTLLTTGTVTITATQGAAGNYSAGTSTASLMVGQMTRGAIMNSFSTIANIGIDISLNGNINCSACDTVNNISYFGGLFNQLSYYSKSIASYNINNNSLGFLDASNIASTNGNIYASVFDKSNNVLYVGGSFTAVYDMCGSLVANNIAKWNCGSQKWSVLGSSATNGTNTTVYSMILDNSYNMYVGGRNNGTTYYSNTGNVTGTIAKWNTSAGSWTTMGNLKPAASTCYSMAYDTSNNVVYAGGNFTSFSNSGVDTSGNSIAKWNVGTSTWSVLGSTSYNGVGSGQTVFATNFDGSNNLYVGGSFTNTYDVSNTNTQIGNNVAIWKPSANSWSLLGNSISNGTSSSVSAIAIDAYNNAYVADASGLVYDASGSIYANSIALWNASVARWSIVGGNATANGFSASGKALSMVFDVSKTYLYVSVPNNASITAYDTSGTDVINSGLIKYNTVTGMWTDIDYPYNLDLTTNTTTGTLTLNTISNTIFVGGAWSTITQNLNNVFAYNATTGRINTLGIDVSNGTSGNVTAMVLDPSNNLYVGGSFVNTYDGSNTLAYVANSVAKWNVGTSSWSLLGNAVGYGVSGAGVYSLVYDGSNGQVYVGGNITSVNSSGVAVNNVAKWNVASGTWSVLGNVTGNGVYIAPTDQTTFINSLVNITAQSGLNNYALNHLKITGSLTNVWGPMASSHDGKYLLITNGGNTSGYPGVGYMYISSNYGVSGSWSPIFTDALRSWITVCVSYTGQYQYAVASYGATVPLYPSAVVNTLIYKSSNYGVDGSWYSLNSNILAGWNLSKMAISANGQYLICISPSPSGTGVYLSTDYGTNFTIVYSNMVTPSNRACLAMSATGNYMTYAEPTNGISISTNYGSSGSWIKVFTPSPTATYPNNQGPSNTTMSSNGQYMYAGMNQNLNNILKSTNYGASGSWYFSSVVLTGYGPGDPNALAASSSGKIIVLGTFAGSNLYISTNYGVSGSFFSIISSSNYFLNVAISPNEQYIYASTYTYSNSNNGNVYMLNIGTPGVRSMTLDNSKNLYVGGTFTGFYDSSATLTTTNKIAYYNQSSNRWSRIGSTATSGVNGNVHATAYDNSNSLLYVGGSFTDVSNSSNSIYGNIAVWNTASSTWSPLGNTSSNGTFGSVNTIQLDVSNQIIYVGGAISSVNDASSVRYATNNIAIWDNSTNLWYPLGLVGNATTKNGTFGNVNTITLNTSSNTLYLGGGFTNAKDASYSYNATSLVGATYDPSKNTNYYGRVPYLRNFPDLSLAFVANGTYTLTTAPTSESNGAFVYTSGNTLIATVSGTTLSFVNTAAGGTILYATQTASGYFFGNTIAASLIINATTTTLSNFAIPNQAYVQGTVVLIQPPTTNSTGAFTYTSANTAVTTISGGYLVMQGTGTNTITAVQSASGNYLQSAPITSASYTTALQRSTAGAFSNLYSPYDVSGAGDVTMNGQIITSVYDASNNYTYFGGNFTSMSVFNIDIFSYNPTLDYVNFYIDQSKRCVVGNLANTQGVHATAIDTSNNLLYVAGKFNTLKDKTGTYSGNNIACFNMTTETWSLLGNTTSNGINRTNWNYGMALQLDNSQNLYVSFSDGTTCYDASGSITSSYIALWNVSNNRWSQLGNATSNGIGTGTGQPALTYDNSNNVLYVTSGGTTYKDASGTITGNNIAIWNPTIARWNVLGSTAYNGTNAYVASVTLDNSYNAYLSGNFTGYYNSAALTSNNYTAKYNYFTNTWTPIVSISGGTVNPGSIVYDGSQNRLYSSSPQLHYFDISNSDWKPMITSYATTTYAVWINYDVKTQNLYVAGNVTTMTDISSLVHAYNGGFKINSTTLKTTPIASAFNTTIPSGSRMTGKPSIHPVTSMVYFGAVQGITPAYNYKYIVGYDNSNSIFFPLGKGGSDVGSNGTNGSVWSIVLDGSSNLYVGGSFTTLYDPSNTSITGNRIGKWTPTTNSWTVMGGNTASNGFNNTVTTLALDTSYNYLYAGGSFTTCYNVSSSITSYYSARWNLGASGWSVMGGNPSGANLNNTVYAMAFDSSKNVYVGGAMTQYYNSATVTGCNRVIKWNAATNQWSLPGGLANAGTNNTVNALAVDVCNNMLYAGGAFTTVTDTAARNYQYVAKLDILNSTWSPIGITTSNGTSGTVNALSIDMSNQSLYVGGAFSFVNDQYYTNYPMNNIAVYVIGSGWKPVGNIASNGVNSTVNSITQNTKTGNLIVSGVFTKISDMSSSETAYYMASITKYAASQFALNNDSNLMMYYSFDGSTWNSGNSTFTNIGQSSYGYGAATSVGSKIISNTTNYLIGTGCVDVSGSSYLSLPNFSVPAKNVTIAFWLNRHAIGGNGDEWYWIWSNSSYQGVYISNNQSTLQYRSTTGASTAIVSSVSLNTWYHIAVVCSSTAANKTTVYINGSSVYTSTTNDYINSATTNYSVLNFGISPDIIYASVDDYRLYARDLSPAEITSLYNYRG